MPTVQVNDMQMYDELHGEGEPLALLVGLGADISEWRGIIGWLATRYRVIALDNRGAGRTDIPDQPYTMELMADDTAKLVQAPAHRTRPYPRRLDVRAHCAGPSPSGRGQERRLLPSPRRRGAGGEGRSSVRVFPFLAD